MLDLSEKLWRRILCCSGNDEPDGQEERLICEEVAECLLRRANGGNGMPGASSEAGEQGENTRVQLREQIARCIRFLRHAKNPDPENKIQEGIDDMKGLLEDIADIGNPR